MEKFKERKQLISLIVLCGSIIALTASLSYAYFTASTNVTKQQELVITSGKLALTFKDNDDTIQNIEGVWNLGDRIEKELIIENTGTLDAYAEIQWENLVNTYLSQSLSYTLEVKPEDETEYTIVRTSNKNVPKSDIATTVPLASGLLIPAGKTNLYRLTIKFEDLINVNQTPDINAHLITKFTIQESTKPAKILLTNELLRKTNPIEITEYTAGDTAEMYTFEHEATDQTEASTDYRYIGNVPSNYITFNDEMWRIIGIFQVEDEQGNKGQQVKIMKEEAIDEIAFDTSLWKDSKIHDTINGDYFNSIGKYSSSGLNEKAKTMLRAAKYYTSWVEYHNSGGTYTDENFYSFERGEAAYNPITMVDAFIIQNVGIIYASDVLYTYSKGIDEECSKGSIWKNVCTKGNLSWIYNGSKQWTMTEQFVQSSSISDMGVWSIDETGGVFIDGYNTKQIRPVVYLNSDVTFLDGDGSQTDPYIIE